MKAEVRDAMLLVRLSYIDTDAEHSVPTGGTLFLSNERGKTKEWHEPPIEP